jgi:general L-amino acid transport system permease protein
MADTVETPVVDPEQVPEPAGPPVRVTSPGEWAKANLFNSAFNSVLTVVFVVFLAFAGYRLLRFVFVTADWEIVRVNLASFLTGNFRRAALWRPAVAILLVSLVSGVGTGVGIRRRGVGDRRDAMRKAAPGLLVLVVLLAMTQPSRTVVPTPVLVALGSGLAYFVGRAVGLRLPPRSGRLLPLLYLATVIAGYLVIARFGGVPWNNWGGLMLNLSVALGAILLAFPFGVLLALGRRSTFPVIRGICVVYIELIRGVPLITLLIMGSTMLGFFLPPGTARPGQATRGLVAFVLFAAAYVAEDVRGGLQSVPKGQVEAANALGLSPIKTTGLIVLPQALRNVIPALIGQFISLTKDTALLTILGVLEVLRVARVVTQQPEFAGQGLQAETLLFTAFLFWSVCFTMSRASQRLEKRLGVGTR